MSDYGPQFPAVMPYSQQAGVMPPNTPMGPTPPGMSPGMAGGAQNPAPGGSPYTYGAQVGPGGMTAQEAFNPLADTRAAMVRAMLNKGWNPEAPTYGVNKLLQRADDIVRQLAGRLASAGQENVLTGSGFQDALNALIGGGGNVISGRAEGQRSLDALKSLVSGAIGGAGGAGGGLGGPGGGGASEGAQFLASILGPDIQSATGFMDSLLYGGMAPNVRSALKRPLAFAPARWDIMAENPQGFEQMGQRSALDILMSGLLGSGAANPWAAGAGGAPGPTAGAMTPPPGLVPGGFAGR